MKAVTHEEKVLKVLFLYNDCVDPIVREFFDLDSEEMLDEKIRVLEELNAGTPRDEIPEYYNILEKYEDDYEQGGEEVTVNLWD